jgi:hypothetical protein
MEAGGLFNASKYKQLKHLPDHLKPKTVFISYPFLDLDFDLLLKEFKNSFPLIAKPDKAERGKGIKLIHNLKDLALYCKNANYDIVIQEYIDYDFEAGVLFYKYPGENKGHISSIVVKLFLSVIGDGKHTVNELLLKDPRNRIYVPKIKINHPNILLSVPILGEKLIIEPIGNHNRGTMFMNGNFLITNTLTEVFHEISTHIPDFHYGRFDLRSSSQENFMIGKDIKIVEVNGVNAEPAHIYEPGTTLIYGLKTILGHWKTIYKLAKANQIKGIKPISFYEFWKLWSNRKL